MTIFSIMNSYLVRPYHVGSKNTKSLAIVIPLQLRRDANIDLSSILLLNIDKEKKVVTLLNVKGILEKCENIISAGQSFQASDQQDNLEISR